MQLTIAQKIYAAIILTSVTLLATTIAFFYHDEKALAEELIEQNLASTAQNYFDSVNTMMLTGTTANRQIVQNKLKEQDGIIEARIIRAPKVVQVYGAGFADQQVESDIDRQGLAGEQITQISQKDGRHVMEYVMPISASENYRGTNCLGCHQAQEGEILGAVKISYDLTKLDKKIKSSLYRASFIQVLISVVGFGALGWVVYKLVIFRLRRLRNNINNVADNLDLSNTIKVHHDDELGAVSSALNHLVINFRSSFETVSSATEKMISSAKEVDDISDISKSAVLSQKRATESVATAINELDVSASEIENNATQTAHKSVETKDISEQGHNLAQQANAGINQLKNEIADNAQMIEQLNAQTKEVNVVLDMITGIAEQTNLLALNAAIEAARAGEQGRGFAVVAEEVRSLAMRTQDAIGQIQETITSLQSNAAQAVDSMTKTSEQAQLKAEDVDNVSQLLVQITEHIHALDDMNCQIDNAAKQQNLAAEEINQHIVNIKDIAEQSSEDVIRGKSVSVHLLELAYELEEQVKRFKLN
ncbi:methyl-accepting chemotaxis protein [Thalassotalea euphylliae]|uniref:Methyl-accepting chemotaxis protein n=1 Tax=Thalassotalea euphylliae TaxID=1655234 RepID=A0A3E0UGD0_9GAMM|nr:methyl-accepting chemotaxis protein [Thalassotalea euphylliae]REL35920.1 methyl-accepting chemotaxis protein [Thalassotalea euphylliae]